MHGHKMKQFKDILKRIWYFSTSLLHHPILGHHFPYVGFCNSFLTALPTCALREPDLDPSFLCSKPSNYFSSHLKAKIINGCRLPFIHCYAHLHSLTPLDSLLFLEYTWQNLTSRSLHYLFPLDHLSPNLLSYTLDFLTQKKFTYGSKVYHSPVL